MRKLFEHYRGRGSAPYTHNVHELLDRTPRSVDEFAREVLLLCLVESGDGAEFQTALAIAKSCWGVA